VAAQRGHELLQQFCADLRLLRTQAGGPSLRQLSGEVHRGKSQVGAILNGEIREPPDWDVVRALLESIRRYAQDEGRLANLSVRTAIDEFWRPRYAVLEHAFTDAPRGRVAAGSPGDVSPADGAADGAVAPDPPHPVLPQQLPAAVRHFAGRAAELDALTDLATEAAGAGAPMLISAIDGMGGIGKTTLAVHWAHRVADRFPDGQLYVDLHGFSPTGSPVRASDALRAFLAALGVSPQRVPSDTDAAAALYRSLLAGRRVLVVLDNARDADHVRPLLPGAPGCLALVTSRHRLTGLVTAVGAHSMALDVLTPDDARDLFVRRIGSARVAAEPGAVDEIIALCGRLPLALAMVAARAAAYPTFSLAALATELRHARGDLAAFSDGDEQTDLRAVFSWSCRRLGDRAGRLFRLLGLHPGAEISVPAAVSLAGETPGAVRSALAELARAHLVRERSPGRFSLHDLLRAYAAELCATVDPPSVRDEAVHRVLDHYLCTAHTAASLIRSQRSPISLPPARPGVVPERLGDEAAATAWFTAEYPALLAAIRSPRALDGHIWRLAWTLTSFLSWRGDWRGLAAAHGTGLAAAERLGDRTGQAHAHRGLARAYTLMGRYDDALDQLRAALALSAELGDRSGAADTHLALSWAYDLQERYRKALIESGRALDLYVDLGDELGQARALNSVGWLHALLGEHREAIGNCERAIALLRKHGDRHAEAATWDSLGFAQHQLGAYQQAVASYRNALQLHHDRGDSYDESIVLIHLGDTWHAAGDGHAARGAWQEALTILEQLGHPDAKQVVQRLADLEPADG